MMAIMYTKRFFFFSERTTYAFILDTIYLKLDDLRRFIISYLILAATGIMTSLELKGSVIFIAFAYAITYICFNYVLVILLYNWL